MELYMNPGAADPEMTADMKKLTAMTDEQRLLLCDLGYYNEIIQGYMIAAMEQGKFDREDVKRAIHCLHDCFDDLSAAEARKIYRRRG